MKFFAFVSLVVLAFACTVHHVHAQPKPVELELVGEWANSSAYVVEVSGGLAYVLGGTNWLYVVDVNNASAPIEVGRFDLSELDIAGSPSAPLGLGQVKVDRNLAFIGVSKGRGGGIAILDISVTEDIQFLNLIPTRWTDFEVAGNRLYYNSTCSGAGCYYDTFNVADVSDPQNPVLVSSSPTFHYGYDLEIEGDFAYIATTGGVLVFDTADPALPMVGSSPGFGPFKIDIHRDLVVMLPPPYWTRVFFVVFSRIDPVNLVRLATLGELGLDIKNYDNYAFIAARENGVTIVDLSDPTQPIVVARIPTRGNALQLEVVNDHLFVSDGESGLSIYKIILPIINPTEALHDLILAIDESSLPDRRQRPLQASLLAALASVEREQVDAAVNQLKAFQNKTRAQVARHDADLAQDLIGAAQEIIEALER